MQQSIVLNLTFEMYSLPLYHIILSAGYQNACFKSKVQTSNPDGF